ncbi:MAG: Gfo/Idh/MocA family oxidoreductase [Elusimicrobiaceae bacterium]|jgi:predicted dehydrogenase|nr:Gfo/Idh/MocA family oxidoreductase [Elusimicrobiaceae bacterium]MBT3955574.1 Gfo/Idh/MocA family oxidoreductase [Elusimicrobiaceae bacterium]MBT4008663.1 Gfo/Idh/MocA family oxidoreductase [Elusimicrobiaceae bacterium]MBT4403041.1 Gfo/Idh/MocA family oxidoreductase [Elusimicrobiaceae bacterium]MBT4439505.1 Gfo/Idh/MocA family oxidoreductase [Elusimicrobiaceae bacterium]
MPKKVETKKKFKKVKFAVIGAGKLGTFHTRTLAKMDGVDLIGVCDPDLARAQKLAWAHNCSPYTKHEDLIPQVDAIIVAAPTQFHHEIGMFALENKVHTLMEKPIAVTMQEAKDMVEMAKKTDTLLQIGHVERFNPAVVEAFKHIKNPQFINIDRLGPYDPRMSQIGVILDLMIHDIDLLLTMIDSDVESFEAIGLSVLSSHEDLANVRFKFKNGAVADVTASRASFERARFMRLYQKNAYISVDFMNARVKMYKKTKPTIKSMKDIDVHYPKVEKQMPITAEILHFIDCINHTKSPWPSGERGTLALELAIQVTEYLERYNLPKSVSAESSKGARAVSDFGKVVKIVFDETIGKIKGGRK